MVFTVQQYIGTRAWLLHEEDYKAGFRHAEIKVPQGFLHLLYIAIQIRLKIQKVLMHC